ncbi:MAG: efflux RND transporter permease subunit [Tannerella sp.]|nr:efflux RND transporter permease subunit [Tannerella sp.]
MIKFLVARPIAVLMAFTACFIVGLITYFTLPVSLLPDIAIPEITIQVTGRNTSARELENTVVRIVRQQLMQVNRLRDIKSETRDGAGLIHLYFDFGVDTDLAFIEVNEKIDAAMNYLPREVERPRVIKASATDIPVLYLNLTLKSPDDSRPPAAGSDSPDSRPDDSRFLSLCDFAETVIKRRIEQLPEVAMVDVTGIVTRQLQIVPDMAQLGMAGITIEDIEKALTDNNIEPGNMTVRDGYYEYNIKFSTMLRTSEDVGNIYLRKSGHIYQLKELASVAIVPEKETGLSLSGNRRAVTLAVIKQADEKMETMKKSLSGVMNYFSTVYPDIEFTVSQNQTELLDYTISNLKQNLSLGFIFICIVAILFLGDIKSPLVIGISMFASLVVSFLFFYLFHMSLNIISLSGLILALGMMIDSSIIVTENISQYRAMGYSLEEACDRGTTEVITPMLSSTLTTIAVFVPLVFMSGIAGAIFYDQAFAVSIGLIASYFTGVMLLPVLYRLIYGANNKLLNLNVKNLIGEHTMDRFYDAGVDFVFRHKTASILSLIVALPLCFMLFKWTPKSRMPEIGQNEVIAFVEWGENIHVGENRARVDALFREVVTLTKEQTAYIGQQQFLLSRDRELSVSEAELYFKTEKPSGILPLREHVNGWLNRNYPGAIISFSPPVTVFEKLFVTGEADLVAEFYSRNKAEAPSPAIIHRWESTITEKTGQAPSGVSFDNQLNLLIDRQKLLLYSVSYDEVYRTLKTAFKDNEAAMLRSYQQYLPITIAGDRRSIDELMRNTLVRTVPEQDRPERYIPLRSIVSIIPGEDLKTITAGKNGEYIPFGFYSVDDAEQLMAGVRESIRRVSGPDEWDVDFSGSFFSNRKMLGELVIILFVSVLLMYFILSAQFESFLQPLIVLIEIPIDTAAALLVLWVCGHSLNLMSAIGIVVTCGVIINDSILKLDAINELRKTGVPLLEAIHEAGRRRLRPIVMTSLTTIFAMLPLLFSFDMGSELQKPLAIAMISAMLIGTVVSLFIIPLVYWMIYRKAAETGK